MSFIHRAGNASGEDTTWISGVINVLFTRQPTQNESREGLLPTSAQCYVTMLKTEPALYEVVGQQNNHLWLEVLEGGDQGIRVSVPVRAPEYDGDLQEQILDLSIGDVETFVLKSEAKKSPDWYICEIQDTLDRETRITA